VTLLAVKFDFVAIEKLQTHHHNRISKGSIEPASSPHYATMSSFYSGIKHFNYVSMKNGTGFLTSGPKNKDNEGEYTVVEAGIKEAVKQLSERKIRASNILDNLSAFYDIQESVAEVMEQSGRDNKYEDLIDNWRAFASIIVMTAVSSYSQHVSAQKKKD
jgi:hypothetical protein